MYVETLPASFSDPLHRQMLISLSKFFLQWSDLLGFVLYLKKKTYPHAFVTYGTEICSRTDLGLCKDIYYCREKDLLSE
ncbi:hypothetical protein QN277_007142 [Acacia crassicarpa]|uniref:Uncharacterized protein n=1 Tax=Acacia crassicarpa TaxID=499986 RepID=A0AAE1M8I9_9FABA|nr:hypothetical protein QN277_007142 [Acacia crassicarpa]